MAKKESTINNIGKIMAPWIVGEYKWVKIGTPMPAGWEKVALEQGHTLVGGTAEGTTSGVNKTVKLDYVGNNYFGLTWNSEFKVSWEKGGTGHSESGYQPYMPTSSKPSMTNLKALIKNTFSSDVQSDYNLAAGIYAELWVYVGE
jgi:hypothetical protein